MLPDPGRARREGRRPIRGTEAERQQTEAALKIQPLRIGCHWDCTKGLISRRGVEDEEEEEETAASLLLCLSGGARVRVRVRI